MLNKKLFSDGEASLIASTKSRTTIEAVNAPAVKPINIFSFSEALTSNFATGIVTAMTFKDFTCVDLRKTLTFGWVLRVVRVHGMVIGIAEVEAAIAIQFSLYMLEAALPWQGRSQE
ncbi:unnamed protein product [Fraxinus pennsylvanica]|uniref:Uncharacterized protein n=1 Tax=Fraxinus pennsylvanica TaxID=56036 RepID=A0AAD2AES3_9LAMI|nr:unnamed protein product [Fraxinus pennsylvanica]